MHDLVIRNGTVVDGSGDDRKMADVAVTDGIVTEVGEVDGPATRTVDAEGQLVLPGWVDIHTHYDGQATWDPDMTPSSWHGVTTAVFGNCGVGFAPVKPGSEDYLINLMEGVEDIPGTALTEGMSWGWESFPEYLDVLSQKQWTLDIGTQVPHAALRTCVMGDDGADNTVRPGHDQIDAMSELCEAAIRAGALGFTTSRTCLSNDRRRVGRARAGASRVDCVACRSADELHGAAKR